MHMAWLSNRLLHIGDQAYIEGSGNRTASAPVGDADFDRFAVYYRAELAVTGMKQTPVLTGSANFAVADANGKK